MAKRRNRKLPKCACEGETEKSPQPCVGNAAADITSPSPAIMPKQSFPWPKFNGIMLALLLLPIIAILDFWRKINMIWSLCAGAVKLVMYLFEEEPAPPPSWWELLQQYIGWN